MQSVFVPEILGANIAHSDERKLRKPEEREERMERGRGARPSLPPSLPEKSVCTAN